MKKNSFIFLLILVVFCGGCTVNPNNEKDEQAIEIPYEEDMYSNNVLQIYGIDNKVIGELELYYIVNQTNDGIVYTKIPKGSSTSITELDYYRYIFETKESIKLGTVKDWSYETNDLICIDNHMYLLITTNIHNENSTVKLFDIDLNNNTMSEVASEKGGDPYNSMAVAGKQILMTRIENDGCSLEEYNTETKEIKHLKKYDFNNDTVTGETIRHISADEDKISILVLKMKSETSVSLRVDVYDHDMNFIRSIGLSSISEDSNELRQPVIHFNVSKKHIYYENFSVTSFLGKIEGNSVVELMKTDVDFRKAYDVEKNETTSLYIQAYSNKNELYLVNEIDGTIKKANFYTDDKKYSIVEASRDSNNNYLLTMYRERTESGDDYEEKLYYIKSTELEFK